SIDGGPSAIEVSTSKYPPDNRSALVNVSGTTFQLREVSYGIAGGSTTTRLTLAPGDVRYYSQAINSTSIYFGGAPESVMAAGGVSTALELVAVSQPAP